MPNKKLKIRSKAIVDVITSNKCGFRVPVHERVELLSENIKKKDLLREWKEEGMLALSEMLPRRIIEEVQEVNFFDIKGNKIEVLENEKVL
jgi:hypothetical protein